MLREVERPVPGTGQVLIEIRACGVCRTDLHILDGELKQPKLPLILGHEIVGRILERGAGCDGVQVGQRVGVPWLGYTCGVCSYCRTGAENLCPQARFTGYQIDGGYAEYAVADFRYCFPIPDNFSDMDAAPLLCAGLIGFRSYRMAGEAAGIGLYGFGAAAHIVAQVAVQQGRKVFAFTRPGDEDGQSFALKLGAVWAGDSSAYPPEPLDAAIIFAPVGALAPAALRAVRPGGRVICAGIHMSDIPSFPYEWLWMEREIRSVANLTRADGFDFFRTISGMTIQTTTQPFRLEAANEALDRLKTGRIQGAAVLAL